MSLSSPNRIIWHYFQALRRHVNNLSNARNEVEKKEDIAICVLLSITVVETFINTFFRILINEKQFSKCKKEILNDLDKRKSLDYKIRNWPNDIFGKSIKWDNGIGKKFRDLKNLRNNLMHFTSSFSKIETNGYCIQGLSDISVLDTLTTENANEAISIAEEMIAEILRIRGFSEEEIKHGIHLWTGKVSV
jgi:hypothetical protein